MHNIRLLHLHVTDFHVDACDQGDEGDVDGKDAHDAAVEGVCVCVSDILTSRNSQAYTKIWGGKQFKVARNSQAYT